MSDLGFSNKIKEKLERGRDRERGGGIQGRVRWPFRTGGETVVEGRVRREKRNCREATSASLRFFFFYFPFMDIQ